MPNYPDEQNRFGFERELLPLGRPGSSARGSPQGVHAPSGSSALHGLRSALPLGSVRSPPPADAPIARARFPKSSHPRWTHESPPKGSNDRESDPRPLLKTALRLPRSLRRTCCPVSPSTTWCAQHRKVRAGHVGGAIFPSRSAHPPLLLSLLRL